MTITVNRSPSVNHTTCPDPIGVVKGFLIGSIAWFRWQIFVSQRTDPYHTIHPIWVMKGMPLRKLKAVQLVFSGAGRWRAGKIAVSSTADHS